MIPLHVHIFDGSTICISVGAETTCKLAKELIAEQIPIAAGDFILTFNGKEITDNEQLVKGIGMAADNEIIMERSKLHIARTELNELGVALSLEALLSNTRSENKKVLQIFADAGLQKEWYTAALSQTGAGTTPSVVEILLKAGAEVDTIYNDVTPLINACRYCETELVKLLLDYGADVNLGVGCRRPLNEAIKGRCDEDLLRLLLEAGADINNGGDNNLLTRAVKWCSSVSHLDILLKAGADPNITPKCEVPPLREACARGLMDHAKLLIKAGSVVKNDYLLDVVKSAVKSESPESGVFVEWFITLPDINFYIESQKSSVLHWVSSRDQGPEILKILLQSSSADVNAVDSEGKTPLFISCECVVPEACKILLQHGADPNICSNKNRSPLFISCYNGCDDVAELLLRHGACVDVPDHHDRTPLFISCECVVPEACKILLQHGADPNICSNKNRSPLFISCYNGCDDVAELLLRHGACVDVPDHHDRTPMFISSKRGYLNCIKLLLSYGAEVGLRDRYNRTPLFIACATNRIDIVRELLVAGSDVDVKDDNSITPIAVVAVEV
eukprot:TRINITY_DN8935_c2_g1_i1.p1 TRINITY_DN8935_c2_g1~~TRINITY_DN8935_c2_g1_i1.p1  ORF type:complete len:562 (+),score=87.76 TRINITY_DN8935_c2_g1_i1:71-1756(+)